MARTTDDDEDLEVKARELWDDPERELDEYDLKLAKLQAELDEEEEAAEAARAKAEAEARAARKRREAEARRAAAAEADGDEDLEDDGESQGELDEEGEALEDEEPAAEDEESLTDRGRRRIQEETDAAAREVASEAMKGGGVKQAALTVAKRRLPGLPTRTQFRNAALGVAGAGVGLWLLWGILAPLFGWAWWIAKWGLVGAAGYGAYKTYNLLPDRGGDADDDEASGEAEDDDEEPLA